MDRNDLAQVCERGEFVD